jgi:hypothetical protein
MPRTDEMLQGARRKRDLAHQIKDQARTMARDSLRVTAPKQAEKLEAEATALETVARATARRGSKRL